jgi:RimJ/RimL family protein N-acetyltransferase
MITGQVVGLRDLRRDDVATLHTAFAMDPAMHGNIKSSPWRPVTLARRLAEFDREEAGKPDPCAITFTVQRGNDPQGRPVGWGIVWGLDEHHRTAHLGVALVPPVRGQGLGRDVLDTLCRYAFEVRDLHRVQLETLGSNLAMQRAALAAGFREEGRLHESAYLMGSREDEVIYGRLASGRGLPRLVGEPVVTQDPWPW